MTKTPRRLSDWKEKIIGAFLSRYPVSSGQEGTNERNAMRLRSVSVFPGFDAASPDEKESYLEAAEALERKGLLSLKWEKRGEGERLKTLSCANMGKLFEAAGEKDPRVEAEEIRALLENKITAMEPRLEGRNVPKDQAAGLFPFLRRLSERVSPLETARGLDLRGVEDFIRLVEFLSTPESGASLTTRALSAFLYNDSKRLEILLELFGPLLAQAQKQGIPVPRLSFLERSFPDTMISGKLVFECDGKPLVNAPGLVLGLPLSSAASIRAIRTIAANKGPAVLTVENKETFYALGDPQRDIRYDCFLYTGGYPNQAAAAIIRVLAASGFRFYHAGDLDPDGILILQHVRDLAGQPVTPVQMNAAAFDRYLFSARPLTGTMLRQLEKIREDTRAIPGLAGLIRRIEETSRGVEQEIIDYRG
ncbi:MAG: DUF2220 domain-containing protein [Spirochaetaceae bacterium]|jgi:hypothetical protein|nr:DUF2220 domain-containing protein [Spirochaetaceae bacterium]